MAGSDADQSERPDAFGQFGWRLALRGNVSESIPMLKKAIERSVSPPGWPFHFIAVDLYLKGDYEHMLNVAEQAALSDTGFSQVLTAIANAELGRPYRCKICAGEDVAS